MFTTRLDIFPVNAKRLILDNVVMKALFAVNVLTERVENKALATLIVLTVNVLATMEDIDAVFAAKVFVEKLEKEAKGAMSDTVDKDVISPVFANKDTVERVDTNP